MVVVGLTVYLFITATLVLKAFPAGKREISTEDRKWKPGWFGRRLLCRANVLECAVFSGAFASKQSQSGSEVTAIQTLARHSNASSKRQSSWCPGITWRRNSDCAGMLSSPSATSRQSARNHP